MRLRHALPSLLTITLVALMTVAAVRSGNGLIDDAEAMRFADREQLVEFHASMVKQLTEGGKQNFITVAATLPVTGEPGSAADKAFVDQWVEYSQGDLAALVLLDENLAVITASGDGSSVPVPDDPGWAELRRGLAEDGVGMSTLMKAGGIPSVAFAAPVLVNEQPVATVAFFLDSSGTNGFGGVLRSFNGLKQHQDEGAELLLFDRNLTLLAGGGAGAIGTKLPGAAGFRTAAAATASGRTEIVEKGIRRVVIYIPVAKTPYVIALVQDASTFYGDIRAQRQRSMLLLFGVIGLLGLVTALLAARRHQVVQRSEAHLTALFGNAGDVVGVVRDGRLAFVSANVDRLVGRPVDDVVGIDPTELFERDEDVAAYHEVLEIATRTPGFAASTELCITCAGSTPRWVDVTAVDLHDNRAVRGILLTLHDVTERKALTAEITHRALHDPLTELANRSLFTDRLELATARLARSDGLAALLYIDLDHFKPINDDYGHAAGDRVLQEIARRLQAVVRPHDTVARLGGDEFAVLVDDLADRITALELARRVSEAVARPIDIGDRTVSVGSSIGVAFATGTGADPETLLQNADLAMYTAKANGRGSVEYFGGHLADDPADVPSS